MEWMPLNFGKHKGKVLPQVLFTDPDWFFWAYNEGALSGLYARQAQRLYLRARRIRLKTSDSEPMVAEYWFRSGDGEFGKLRIVPKSSKEYTGTGAHVVRKPYLDLGLPYEQRPFDKEGCKRLVQGVKLHLFGTANARMTPQRCIAFFEDRKNFRVKKKSKNKKTTARKKNKKKPKD